MRCWSNKPWMRSNGFAFFVLLFAVCLSGYAETRDADASGVAVDNTAAISAGALAPAGDGQHPNIVLLILDTVRADAMSCYGGTHDAMPALDALAAQGVIFENVLSQSSWTRPSIGSFLTSKYPRTIGIYDEEDDTLDDRYTQFAEILHDAGYVTLGFTANPNLNKAFNFHQGFDEYSDSEVIFGWMPPEHGKQQRGQKSLPSANDLFDRALKSLDVRGKPAVPYYLQFNFMEVHEWVVPSYKSYAMLRKPYTSLYRDDPHAPYWQSARQLSDDVAKFIETLSRRPGWENTLFIVVSDHGEGLGDHPDVEKSLWHGRVLYESNVRVPWFLYRPGWRPAQQRVAMQVRLLDLMPTALALAGVSVPEDLDGASLAGYIEGCAAQVNLPELNVAESEFKDSNKIAVYGKEWEFIQSYAPHPGIAPLELQTRGAGNENGIYSNQYNHQPHAARRFERYLHEWERKHPKTPPTTVRGGLSSEMQDRLKALGYLDGDESRGNAGAGAAPAENTLEEDPGTEAEDTSP